MLGSVTMSDAKEVRRRGPMGDHKARVGEKGESAAETGAISGSKAYEDKATTGFIESLFRLTEVIGGHVVVARHGLDE